MCELCSNWIELFLVDLYKPFPGSEDYCQLSTCCPWMVFCYTTIPSLPQPHTPIPILSHTTNLQLNVLQYKMFYSNVTSIKTSLVCSCPLLLGLYVYIMSAYMTPLSPAPFTSVFYYLSPFCECLSLSAYALWVVSEGLSTWLHKKKKCGKLLSQPLNTVI